MIKKNAINNKVANALIWASMMIALSLLMMDSKNGGMMLLLMVGGWLASNKLMHKD